MKTYKGILKGNTIVGKAPDLPDECPALVEIKPLDQDARDEEITRHQLELLKHPHKGESSSIGPARNSMTAGKRLLDTNILVHAYVHVEARKHTAAQALVLHVWKDGDGLTALHEPQQP